MLYGPCLLPIAKKSSLLQKADVSADKETYFFLVVTLLAWLERWALNYRKEFLPFDPTDNMIPAPSPRYKRYR
jgi:hypothetical protein